MRSSRPRVRAALSAGRRMSARSPHQTCRQAVMLEDASRGTAIVINPGPLEALCAVDQHRDEIKAATNLQRSGSSTRCRQASAPPPSSQCQRRSRKRATGWRAARLVEAEEQCRVAVNLRHHAGGRDRPRVWRRRGRESGTLRPRAGRLERAPPPRCSRATARLAPACTARLATPYSAAGSLLRAMA